MILRQARERRTMSEQAEGCVQPSQGPILAMPEKNEASTVVQKEVSMTLARVGKPAPDFELSAFHEGGFKNVKLSDSKGKWIVVCFYPGDFTFV
jgi:peroxiredoxin (alkyl hydroperoxide reductase subunit C)